MNFKQLLILLLAVINCHTAFCQNLDASPAGIMISHSHPKGGWMASYTYMNMYMNSNLSGSKKVNDDTIWNNYIFAPHNMRMDMHMLMGMYGMTGRLSFMLMANYINCSMDLSLPPGTVLVHHHGDSSMTKPTETSHSHATSGFGDLKLWGIYKWLNGQGSSLVFSAGINFPTGKFDILAGEHAIYDGERHPYMMQLGTGSFDFMPGLTYLKKTRNISWSIQALVTIRPFYNSIGYHYGNELNINTWAAYQLCPALSASARLEGYMSGVIQGRDPQVYDILEPDANPNNYGGQRVNGYIGINVYFNKRFLSDSKFVFEFGIPLYQNLNGPQLATRHILNAGITKSF